MHKYVLLNTKQEAVEIIPEINPDLPGFALNERYSADFIKQLIEIDEDTLVGINWVYDPETKTFSEPVVPDVQEDPDATQEVNPMQYGGDGTGSATTTQNDSALGAIGGMRFNGGQGGMV